MRCPRIKGIEGLAGINLSRKLKAVAVRVYTKCRNVGVREDDKKGTRVVTCYEFQECLSVCLQVV